MKIKRITDVISVEDDTTVCMFEVPKQIVDEHNTMYFSRVLCLRIVHCTPGYRICAFDMDYMLSTCISNDNETTICTMYSYYINKLNDDDKHNEAIYVKANEAIMQHMLDNNMLNINEDGL